jgi:hypothetical protein
LSTKQENNFGANFGPPISGLWLPVHFASFLRRRTGFSGHWKQAVVFSSSATHIFHVVAFEKLCGDAAAARGLDNEKRAARDGGNGTPTLGDGGERLSLGTADVSMF